MGIRIDQTAEGAVVWVKVVPNSSRDVVVGALGEDLKVKVSQPPEGGKANAAVEELLARTLGVPPARVRVVAGHGQPRKRVLVVGMATEKVRELVGD